ncbi:HD domain-containing protein [Bacillus suaedaesalsae]|uniref:HD domain-containing protein n=1 Tax=Bacillus suaedaesalsae TaxID=2810349 RepID=A0ABS2DLH3_9BACI|nr:HD domain-containing protein [Bacillus suaedaesalsae]MBM6619342.1 HD domain-containing protein [Bacillus suaedaesalsae]
MKKEIYMNRVIEQTKQFVKNELQNEATGHDWWHIVRVHNMARAIAETEQANGFIVEMAALLHDIADEKLNPTEEIGLQRVRDWLDQYEILESDRHHILTIIKNMSFKGGNKEPLTSIEGMIVQDADRLDAIGAIGIARTFAYGGAKGDVMHDPDLAVREKMSKEEYRTGKSTPINHFYEKLLKLKDLMNTDTGKQLAEERHQFMVQYLQQFMKEWNGQV